MGIQLNSQFTIGTSLPIDDRMIVADLTARDALIAGRRYEGLVVYVISDGTSYQLQGGITDSDWVEFGAGGSVDPYRFNTTSSRISTSGTIAELTVTGLTIGRDYRVSLTAYCNRAATGVDEVQLLQYSAVPDAGDFTLTFDGQTTAVLGWDAVASEVESALIGLSNIDASGVSVSGDFTTGFQVTFQGTEGSTNQAQITVSNNNLESGGTGGTNEVQTINFDATADAGSFTITFDGQTTGSIAWNASAATVESALEALPNINGVTVAGSSGSFTVTFDGSLVDNRDVPQLTVNSSLTRQVETLVSPTSWEFNSTGVAATSLSFTDANGAGALNTGTGLWNGGSQASNLMAEAANSVTASGANMEVDGYNYSVGNYQAWWTIGTGIIGSGTYRLVTRISASGGISIYKNGNSTFGISDRIVNNTITGFQNIDVTFSNSSGALYFLPPSSFTLNYVQIDYLRLYSYVATAVTVTVGTSTAGAAKTGGTAITTTESTTIEGIANTSGTAERFGLSLFDNAVEKLTAKYFPPAGSSEDGYATVTDVKIITADATSITVEAETSGAPNYLEAGCSVLVEDVDASGAAVAPSGGGGFVVTATQDITAAGTILLGSEVQQWLKVQGDAGAQTAATAPFASSPSDGTIIVLEGQSDTNTLTINSSDSAGGCLLNGDVVLGANETINLLYDATANRWKEISRSH